jgi:hypothetical protein
MPYAMVPPGYKAVLLGQAQTIEDLGTFVPLEESTDEGALILMRLDFDTFPSSETLAQLNQACLDKGIPPWPGNGYIVYADTTQPSIYLAWQKGFAWMPIIIGLLVTTVLPALLGALSWWILPQGVKDLITELMNMGIMVVFMWVMSSVLKPLSQVEKPKAKQVTQPKPAQVESASEATA